MRRVLHLLLIGMLMLAPVAAAAAQCNDGIDNDANGYTDYPQDTGCFSLDDDAERTENIVLRMSLTDGEAQAERGETLSYTLVVSNEGADPFTGNLDVTISSLAVFMNIPAEAVQIDPKIFRIAGFTMLPGQTKTVMFSAQIMNRIPADGAVTASARLGTEQAFDSTLVRRAPRFVSSSSRSSSSLRSISSSSSSRSSASSSSNAPIPLSDLSRLFSVTANATEVLPGGSVRFDVTVRNTLRRPMENPVLSVTFDAGRFALRGDAFVTADPDRMVWIPVNVEPGQTWTESFTLTADPSAAPGPNVVTLMLEADDLMSIPLMYRTESPVISILTKLPETGAGLDVILLTLSGVSVSAIGSSLVRRRKKFSSPL